MKCEDCKDFYCHGKFENRIECSEIDFDGFTCNCVCQVPKRTLYSGYFLSFVAGGAAIAGGMALTSANDNPLAKMGGTVLYVAGLKLIITPLQKSYAFEHLTLKFSLTEAATGAITGAVAFGIRHKTAAMADKASHLILKHLIPVAGSGFAGAIGGVLREAARYFNGERVTLFSTSKSIHEGILFGSAVAMPYELSQYLQQRSDDMKFAAEIEAARIINSQIEIAELRSGLEAARLKTSEIEAKIGDNSKKLWTAFVLDMIITIALNLI